MSRNGEIRAGSNVQSPIRHWSSTRAGMHQMAMFGPLWYPSFEDAFQAQQPRATIAGAHLLHGVLTIHAAAMLYPTTPFFTGYSLQLFPPRGTDTDLPMLAGRHNGIIADAPHYAPHLSYRTSCISKVLSEISSSLNGPPRTDPGLTQPFPNLNNLRLDLDLLSLRHSLKIHTVQGPRYPKELPSLFCNQRQRHSGNEVEDCGRGSAVQVTCPIAK